MSVRGKGLMLCLGLRGCGDLCRRCVVGMADVVTLIQWFYIQPCLSAIQLLINRYIQLAYQPMIYHMCVWCVLQMRRANEQLDVQGRALGALLKHAEAGAYKLNLIQQVGGLEMMMMMMMGVGVVMRMRMLLLMMMMMVMRAGPGGVAGVAGGVGVLEPGQPARDAPDAMRRGRRYVT
jgi:hypothetical protein